jgi:hypothetical protein
MRIKIDKASQRSQNAATIKSNQLDTQKAPYSIGRGHKGGERRGYVTSKMIRTKIGQ